MAVPVPVCIQWAGSAVWHDRAQHVRVRQRRARVCATQQLLDAEGGGLHRSCCSGAPYGSHAVPHPIITHTPLLAPRPGVPYNRCLASLPPSHTARPYVHLADWLSDPANVDSAVLAVLRGVLCAGTDTCQDWDDPDAVATILLPETEVRGAARRVAHPLDPPSET